MNKSIFLALLPFLFLSLDLPAQQDEPIEEIIATGTRIVRTDHYQESGHVVKMDEVAIDAQAELNIADILRNNPLNSHGSLNEQSGRSAQSNAGVNLRGLGAERTLILVDGMRVPGSPNYTAAAANINMLPMAAVKRVDILADGASAVYGSDAMAGVVNLVLHRDYEGIEVSMRYGDRSRDDGGDRSFSLLGGVIGDKGNVVIAMEYSHRDPIFDRDRWYTAPQIEDSDGDGEIHWWLDTVGIAYSGRTWEIFDPITGYLEWRAAADCPETDGFTGVMGLGVLGAWDETVCTYAVGEIAANRAELEKLNGYMYASYELSDRAELYTRVLITKNESFGRWAPVPGVWEPPADHPHNPFDMEQMIADGLITDQAELLGHYRWTNIGPRDGNFTDVQWDFSAGVKGELSDRAKFDFHAQTGRYDSTEVFRHSLNYIGLDYVQRNNIDPFSELGIAAMAAQLTQDNFTKQSRIYGHTQIDAWDVFGAGESIALLPIMRTVRIVPNATSRRCLWSTCCLCRTEPS
jgi:iron complex outermembrane receptor protein